MYCIVDVETTGGNPKYSKITEVAIYKFDGHAIVDEFVSLVNPEVIIPDYIIQLTGITNDMVKSAPKFYEIAARIIEITQDCIFVAHNVSFDYACFQTEFSLLGYHFQLPHICSIRLARVLLPGHRSYSLGNICADLNIEIDARHRAGGDAFATVQLFQLLLKKNQGVINIDNPYHTLDESLFHPDFDIQSIVHTPEDAGVFQLIGEEDEIIYIGHGRNVRNQVLSYLYRSKSLRTRNMIKSIRRIDFIKTGSVLIASLVSDEMMAEEKPRYNKKSRSKQGLFGLLSYVDQRGYKRFQIANSNKHSDFISFFDSKEEGVQSLYRYVDEYQLCLKLCGLYDGNDGCQQYQLHQCKGACVGEESPFLYNERATELLKQLNFKYPNRVIIDKGRLENEYSIVLVNDDSQVGWGFFSADDAIMTAEDFRGLVKMRNLTYNMKLIIEQYLESNPKPIKIIDLNNVI